MSEWTDLVLAFGQSDEFSFLLPASSTLYSRRSAKISTSFVSLFSSRCGAVQCTMDGYNPIEAPVKPGSTDAETMRHRSQRQRTDNVCMIAQEVCVATSKIIYCSQKTFPSKLERLAFTVALYIFSCQGYQNVIDPRKIKTMRITKASKQEYNLDFGGSNH